MQSPYEPPRAPVADLPVATIAQGKRPLSVSMASLLLVLVAIWQLSKILSASGFQVGVHLFWVLALTSVGLMLERGRNWARWALVGLAALSAFSLVAVLVAPVMQGLRAVPDYAGHLRHLTAESCLIFAAVLVFGPGRAWFKVPR